MTGPLSGSRGSRDVVRRCERSPTPQIARLCRSNSAIGPTEPRKLRSWGGRLSSGPQVGRAGRVGGQAGGRTRARNWPGSGPRAGRREAAARAAPARDPALVEEADLVATCRAKPISWVASTMVMPPSASARPTTLEHLADQFRVQRARRSRRRAATPAGCRARGRGRRAAAGRRRAGRGRAPPFCQPGRTAQQPACPVHGLASARRGTLLGASVQFSSTVRCGNRL